MGTDSGQRSIRVLAIALLVALGLPAEQAQGRTRRLEASVPLPTTNPDGRLNPHLTVVTLPPIRATGARLLVGEALVRYVVTPESDHWRRNVLVGVRVVCRDQFAHVYQGPYTTTNWVWTAGPRAVDNAGPDVKLATRMLIKPLRATAARPARLSCSLVAHTGYAPAPMEKVGLPRLEVVGSARDGPTFLHTSVATEAGGQVWRAPRVAHVAPASSAFVLARTVTAGQNLPWLYAGADAELTSCYEGGASCPAANRGVANTDGSMVQTRLEVTQLGADGKPCGRLSDVRRRTTPITTFISNDTHHAKISTSLWLRRPRRAGERCRNTFEVRLMLRVLSGNPVRLEGKRYSGGLWLQRRNRG
jgi:hypothetical protein